MKEYKAIREYVEDVTYSNKKYFKQPSEFDFELVELLNEIKRLRETISTSAQLDAVRSDLEEIRDFGFSNPGLGYSCAKKIDAVLSKMSQH